MKSSAIYTPNAYEVNVQGSENGRVVTIVALLHNPNNPVVIFHSLSIASQKAERIGDGKGLNYSSYLLH